MQETLDKLKIELKKMFDEDSSGHDFHHLKRVLNLALKLQEKEGGDRLVIAVSALLHDVHRMIENETGAYCSPKDSLPRVKEILDKIELSEEQKNLVLRCVEFHDDYSFSKKGNNAKDKETLIIQDADNLDAMGAIGVARAFAFSGSHNIPIWVPEIPFNRESFDEREQDPSEIHHFYSKLLKLKENMNTKTGKRMAEKRQDFMKLYLEEFFNEWKGEK